MIPNYFEIKGVVIDDIETMLAFAKKVEKDRYKEDAEVIEEMISKLDDEEAREDLFDFLFEMIDESSNLEGLELHRYPRCSELYRKVLVVGITNDIDITDMLNCVYYKDEFGKFTAKQLELLGDLPVETVLVPVDHAELYDD